MASAELSGASAAQIGRQVRDGDVSAVEVARAHLDRIAAVNGALNAIVVPLFDAALAQAQQLDERRRRGEALGPLAGVPITVKECLEVAGTAATFGLAGLQGRISASDGPLVARLRAAGAVIVGKTNVPPLGMHMETEGPLFGRTSNPWDLSRSPGGSSGGDAAIVAAAGVPLALATDAGGSIRQPAHACGICGLKPTSGRLTQTDLLVTTTAADGVRMPVVLAGLHSILQPGPLARTVEDLTLAMETLAAPGQHEIDATVSPTAWPDPRRVELAGLRIGMYVDDGVFPAAPAVRRAVEEAAASLASLGCHVEPFAPPDVPAAMRTFQSLLIPDGGRAFRRMLGDSPPDRKLKNLLAAAGMPNALRPVVAAFLELTGQPRLATSIRNLRQLSAHEFRQRLAQRAEYLARFLAALDAGRFDAVLCPVSPLPAAPHGQGEFLGLIASHTSLYNYLGLPAGAVPITRVRPEEAQPRAASRCRVEQMARHIETGSQGLPIGVQVAARPWREDIVLALLSALERQARTQPDYPQRPPL